ncbi:NMDA receptor-regulated protein 1 domain-containing protein [Ditylenchus destructor]|uniref:NMDA receptor-regulated protein 1 domain-containing protein n=1 Tax=Ditylenchus destructor TaxID=166010 RepID=A0AAD4RBW5_9BILA|nr:NMDA receptor-regulated protein 1 domain-containing protein [Ditylenchus destructor]
MSASTSNNQTLPTKELATFKKILKCYEQKQYKAGLRCAKQILSNPQYSEHGETLAMKGLILNCMGKHDEAMEIVKRGLTANVKSHICWHVFGLVQRSDKKYDEAMKAYKMALRIDHDNLQILRDLSLLQIQMRDLEGYRDSRHQLLVLRPSTKMSWIGYANACHLLGDYEMALNIIRDFKKNNRPASQFDFENGELVLYECMILREAGKAEFALTKLEENSTCVIDRVSYFETRAELLIELGKLNEAEKVYWGLIDRNPDNVLYYTQLEKCLQINTNSATANGEKIKNIYDNALERKPKASIPQLLKLFCLEGKAFEDYLSAYLINFFRKGVPSLFKNLVPLYQNPAKTAVIEKLLLEFVKKSEENGYDNTCLDGSILPECPTTFLWIYYYLAQHFDRLRQFQKAHKYIDEALKHTPTLIELYMAKAKIYKHAGEFPEAAKYMDQAQELDTADRYINSKCAKYMLRAGMMGEAEAMCSKFTREGVNATESLSEMQCMWYELESAKAYNMLGKYGDALKKCHQVERHFTSFYEDQYDFHSYCIRKMTLCSYVKVLRFEDELKSHRYYVEAAKLAASIYIRMVERPEDFHEKIAEDSENMSAAELRKMRRKANKAKAAEEKSKINSQSGAPTSVAKRRIDGELDVVEPEPLDPAKLVKVENPIDEAAKFVQPVLQLPCKDVELCILGFDIYYHKNKLMAMLLCLKKAQILAPNDQKYLDAFKRFSIKYNESKKCGHIPSGAAGDLLCELADQFLKS